jgi:hypothetical protein
MRNISLFCILSLLGCSSISPPVVTPTQSTATLPATTTSTESTKTTTPTPDFYATDYLINLTAIVETVVASEQPRIYKSYPSPDEKWLAQITIYDCIKIDARPNADPNAYEQLRLINVSSREEKLADGQLQYCGNLGAFGLEGLNWSSNSRYFYYTNGREGVPDGCGYWEKPILRLDINALKIEELGGGPISPDGTKIVTWQGKELVIRDINTGFEIGRITPYILNTETGTGPIIWSPDSQAFVYVQSESYCPLSGNSHIVRLDLPKFEQTILLESESPTFGGARWLKINELRLFDENGKQWVYTFNNQKLEPLR